MIYMGKRKEQSRRICFIEFHFYVGVHAIDVVRFRWVSSGDIQFPLGPLGISIMNVDKFRTSCLR